MIKLLFCFLFVCTAHLYGEPTRKDTISLGMTSEGLARFYSEGPIFDSLVEPSAFVHGCVNALTGTFVHNSVDLQTSGHEPISFSRIYNHHAVRQRFCMATCYSTNHPTHIEILPGPGNTRTATVEMAGGAYIPYVSTPGNPNFLTLAPEAYGFANYAAGEISARTHLKNSSIELTYSGNTCICACLRTGDGGSYHYNHRQLLEAHVKPNGNIVRYAYTSFERAHNLISRITTMDKTDTVPLNWISMEYKSFNRDKRSYSIVATASNGMSATYQVHFGRSEMKDDRTFTIKGRRMDEDYHHIEYPQLTQAESFLKPFCIQHFNKSWNKRLTCELSRFEYPDGRGLHVTYKDKHYVASLQLPVGNRDRLIDLYKFQYEANCTVVSNCFGEVTRYYHQEKNRVTEIVRGSTPYSRNKFFWGTEGTVQGNLMGKALTDADGLAVNALHYTYDDRGNILEERSYGNISGKGPDKFSLNTEGLPTTQVESYGKRKTYSTDGFNLLLSETGDDGLTVTYQYYPETDQLRSKYTSFDNKILLREFYTYDRFGTRIQTISDDGSHTDINVLEGATQRTISTTHPVENPNAHSFGLPYVIVDSYYDFDTGQEVQLRKTVNLWGSRDLLLHYQPFDANDVHQYTLNYTYSPKGLLLSETDPHGQLTTYAYDANFNKIREEREGSGYFTTFVYDKADRMIESTEVHKDGSSFTTLTEYDFLGKKTRQVDPYGHATTYTYDSYGREIQITYPTMYNLITQGSHIPTEKKAYNIQDQVISFTDLNNHTTHTEYNVSGQPTRITYPDGSQERFEYNLNGTLAKKWEKNGLLVCYTYDPLKRVIRTEEKEGDTVLRYTTATYSGFNLLTQTDSNGNETHYQYDGAGRKISETQGERKTTYAYDSMGRLCTTTQWLKDGYLSVCETFDLLNRPVETTTIDHEGTLYSKKTYLYDVNGNVTQTLTQIDPETIRVEKSIYNSKSLPICHITPEGHETKIEYNHQFINPFNQRVLQKTTTDPIGNRTITTYYPTQLPCFVEKFDPRGVPLSSTKMFYSSTGDLMDQQDAVLWEGKHMGTYLIQWQYNFMRQNTAIIDQGSKVTQFTYDSDGKLTTLTRPSGLQIHYDYDLLRRLTSITSSDQSIHYTFTYDLNDNLLNAHDLVHNQSCLYTYNGWNEKITETLPNQQPSQFDYDPTGRLTTHTLPDGSSIKYRYNPCDLTAVERYLNNNLAYQHIYKAHDLEGKVLLNQLPQKCGTLTQNWDICGRCVSTHHTNWQETIDRFDPLGNILQITTKDPLGAQTSTYTYDGLNQLTSDNNTSYIHDSLYNRRQKGSSPVTINEFSQLTHDGTDAYLYDANGNLSTHTSTQYRYDALNRLISAEKPSHYKATYTYDHSGRRLTKTLFTWVNNHWKEEDTLNFLYQGDHEIGAIGENTSQLRLLGNTQRADIGATIAIELDNTLYIPIHDHRGNIRILLDPNTSQSLQCYRYTAFGETTSEGPIQNPWQYCSKRLDEETGLYHFNKRYYIPTIGRWLTTDPLYFEDGPNLYAYVQNNPLVLYDPYGLFSWNDACDYSKGFAKESLNRVAVAWHETLNTGAGGVAGYAFQKTAMSLSPVYKAESHAAMHYWDNRRGYLNTGSSNFFKSAGAAVVPGIMEACHLPNNASYSQRGASHGSAFFDTLSFTAPGLFLKAAVGINRAVTGLGRAIAPAGRLGVAKGGVSLSHGAESVNAGIYLNKKLSQLQSVQKLAVKTRTLPDGRIRYYRLEIPALTNGPTRGSAYVTEFNPKTMQTRTWMECYDHFGKINRVHPKQINGQEVLSPHYPLTKKELGL